MLFTQENLNVAISSVLPGSENWDVNIVTLLQMAAVELFVFQHSYDHVSSDHIELIRIALRDLKLKGQMNFV